MISFFLYLPHETIQNGMNDNSVAHKNIETYEYLIIVHYITTQ
jgi:hypothetical protein